MEEGVRRRNRRKRKTGSDLFFYDVVFVVETVIGTFLYGAGSKPGIVVLVHTACHADIVLVIIIVAIIAAGIAAVLNAHGCLLCYIV